MRTPVKIFCANKKQNYKHDDNSLNINNTNFGLC